MRKSQMISHSNRRRGTVAVIVAVSLVAILGVVAISVDGGSMLTEKRQSQTVADAAALAAASDLFENYWYNSGDDPSGSASASALAIAAANGYKNDGINSVVSVKIPPETGFYKGKRGYVEVIVEYKFKRGFSAVFGSDDIPIRSRAVAIGMPVAADVGILVLDPSKRSALNTQGSAVSIVKGTPVIVNSKHSEGTVVGGGGMIEADKFVLSGDWTTPGGGQLIGPVFKDRPPTEDPLKDIPPPDPNKLATQSKKKIQYSSGDHYLQPGIYKGGINVSGTGNLTLEPGVYYMDGGGFQFTGQGKLVGKNVMIYNQPRPGQADGISVTGQGSMILSGPTSGPYQGLTFFQNRTSNVTGEVAGTGGETSITGTFYFPGALLKINGNGGVANVGSQYISRELTLGGNGGINVDWDPYTVARKRAINLVE